MITRDSFLSITCEIRPIAVADGRGTLHGFVRMMTAGEKDRFEAEHNKAPEIDFRARIVAATLCDESGRLIFTRDDVPTLSALPAADLDPIVREAIKVNRMTPEDLEDLRKN